MNVFGNKQQIQIRKIVKTFNTSSFRVFLCINLMDFHYTKRWSQMPTILRLFSNCFFSLKKNRKKYWRPYLQETYHSLSFEAYIISMFSSPLKTYFIYFYSNITALIYMYTHMFVHVYSCTMHWHGIIHLFLSYGDSKYRRPKVAYDRARFYLKPHSLMDYVSQDSVKANLTPRDFHFQTKPDKKLPY